MNTSIKVTAISMLMMGNISLSMDKDQKEYNHRDEYSSSTMNYSRGWGWNINFSINSAEASDDIGCYLTDTEDGTVLYCPSVGDSSRPDATSSNSTHSTSDETSSCWYEIFSGYQTVKVTKNTGWTGETDSNGNQIYKAGWDFTNVSSGNVYVATIRDNNVLSTSTESNKYTVELTDSAGNGRTYYYKNLNAIASGITAGSSAGWHKIVGTLAPGQTMEVEIFNNSFEESDYGNYSIYPEKVVSFQDASGPVNGACSTSKVYNN